VTDGFETELYGNYLTERNLELTHTFNHRIRNSYQSTTEMFKYTHTLQK